MKTKKGFIHSINLSENIGFIDEENFNVRFIFFLDELDKHTLRALTPGSTVSFQHDTSFELSMFVAKEIELKTNHNFSQKAG